MSGKKGPKEEANVQKIKRKEVKDERNSFRGEVRRGWEQSKKEQRRRRRKDKKEKWREAKGERKERRRVLSETRRWDAAFTLSPHIHTQSPKYKTT